MGTAGHRTPTPTIIRDICDAGGVFGIVVLILVFQGQGCFKPFRLISVRPGPLQDD